MHRTIITLIIVISAPTCTGTASDWIADFDTFLNKYVVKTTKGSIVSTSVNYGRARKNNAAVKLRARLARVSDLSSLKKNERLSFWLNAYNFLAIDTVIRNPSIKKLTDLNRFFKSV